MTTSTYHDLIIVGGGPAGQSAAIYATRAGVDMLAIEQAVPGGQISTTDVVDNYPGLPEITGAELGMKFQEHAEMLGATYAYDSIESVAKTDEGFELVGADATYRCKSLIYAAGAEPRLAGFEGEQEYRGRGVSYCATCDGMFYRNKKVFVIGGGNSACEEALFLSRFASSVDLIVRKDHVRAVASLLKQIEANEKITIRYLTSITSVQGESLPSTITFRDNASGTTYSETYDAGSFGIFVAVGTVPNTNLVEGFVELEQDGGIVVDRHMATKTEGLYCAGDVCSKPLRQVLTAAADGAIAATSAAMYLGELVI